MKKEELNELHEGYIKIYKSLVYSETELHLESVKKMIDNYEKLFLSKYKKDKLTVIKLVDSLRLELNNFKLGYGDITTEWFPSADDKLN